MFGLNIESPPRSKRFEKRKVADLILKCQPVIRNLFKKMYYSKVRKSFKSSCNHCFVFVGA